MLYMHVDRKHTHTHFHLYLLCMIFAWQKSVRIREKQTIVADIDGGGIRSRTTPFDK